MPGVTRGFGWGCSLNAMALGNGRWRTDDGELMMDFWRAEDTLLIAFEIQVRDSLDACFGLDCIQRQWQRTSNASL
jgi:hypothetical protein